MIEVNGKEYHVIRQSGTQIIFTVAIRPMPHRHIEILQMDEYTTLEQVEIKTFVIHQRTLREIVEALNSGKLDPDHPDQQLILNFELDGVMV